MESVRELLMYRVAGAVAILSALWVIGKGMKSSLNGDAFLLQIQKLVRANNVSRAIRLCSAAPTIPLVAATRSALEWSQQPESRLAREDDFRGLRDSARADVTTMREALRAAFTDAFAQASRALFQTVPVAIVAWLVASAALVWRGDPALRWMIVVAAILMLFGLYRVWRTRGDVETYREPVIEVIAEHMFGTDAPSEQELSDIVDLHFPMSESGRLYLSVLNSRNPTVAYRIGAQVVKLGSSDMATLRLNAPDVSRMHSVIEVSDEAVQVIDLGSRVGTWVNGEPVAKRDLKHNDVLQLGSVRLGVGVDGPFNLGTG